MSTINLHTNYLSILASISYVSGFYITPAGVDKRDADLLASKDRMPYLSKNNEKSPHSQEVAAFRYIVIFSLSTNQESVCAVRILRNRLLFLPYWQVLPGWRR